MAAVRTRLGGVTGCWGEEGVGGQSLPAQGDQPRFPGPSTSPVCGLCLSPDSTHTFPRPPEPQPSRVRVTASIPAHASVLTCTVPPGGWALNTGAVRAGPSIQVPSNHGANTSTQAHPRLCPRTLDLGAAARHLPNWGFSFLKFPSLPHPMLFNLSLVFYVTLLGFHLKPLDLAPGKHTKCYHLETSEGMSRHQLHTHRPSAHPTVGPLRAHLLRPLH